MKAFILGAVLLIQGVIDLKYKEIPFWVSAVGAVLGIGISILEKREVVGLLLAVLPGVLALLFARASREALGYGDGVLFIVMGIYLSLGHVLEIAMMAFGIAGICALILIVVFRKKRDDQIPFVPFLTVSYILWLFINEGGYVW